MRRVIDRKVYDTSNARRLTRSDFGLELYVTRNGRYFAAHWDHFDTGGDYIEPLTMEKAIKLYETHNGAEQSARAYVEFEDAFPSIKVSDA